MTNSEVQYYPIREAIDSLRRYADMHVETGSFLRAVLENDLREACARADISHRRFLFDIVLYLHNEVPYQCWGSPERVDAWLRQPIIHAPKEVER